MSASSERLERARRNQARATFLATFYDNARNNGNGHLAAFEALADLLHGSEDLIEREAKRRRDEAEVDGYKRGWHDGYRALPRADRVADGDETDA